MRTSVTQLLDDTTALLLRAPDLVAQYEQAAPDFAMTVLDWLSHIENVLKKYRNPKVSAIAGIKAQVLAAKAGLCDTGFIQLPTTNQPSKRKHLNAVAALLFNRAQVILSDIHGRAVEKRDEALKYLRQMTQLIDQQGMVATIHWNDRGKALAALFATMRSNAGTSAAARHVLSLVNYADALRLLDDIVDEWSLAPAT